MNLAVQFATSSGRRGDVDSDKGEYSEILQ